MRRFKFTLQPVLEHRTRIEEEKQQIVAQRGREVMEAEAELARLNERFRAGAAELREGHRGFDAQTLRAHYAHLQFLDGAIVAQISVVAERRVAHERARADLLAASKERKVVEKLKERRRVTFMSEEALADQKELDDMNARRHGRNRHVAGGML